MVDEEFRMECENMFGRNLERIEALEKQMKLALENDDEQDDVLETHETVLRDYFKYRKDWSELIMKKSPYGSPLDTWMMISLHKFMKDALEKFDASPKKEYIASLNDPKAFEAINLGILKRERKSSGDDVLDMKKGQNPQQLCERCKFESDCPHSHADSIDGLGCDSFEEKTKEQILKEFKKRLSEPIPNFWKASIKSGAATEYDYYAKIIPNQLFIRRQKIRLIERFTDDLQSEMTAIQMLQKWRRKLNQIREGK